MSISPPLLYFILYLSPPAPLLLLLYSNIFHKSSTWKILHRAEIEKGEGMGEREDGKGVDGVRGGDGEGGMRRWEKR